MKNDHNRIPRNAKKLDVTFKLKALDDGENHMIATKDDDGWHGVTDNGKCYYLFASHLRNASLCDIKVIA